MGSMALIPYDPLSWLEESQDILWKIYTGPLQQNIDSAQKSYWIVQSGYLDIHHNSLIFMTPAFRLEVLSTKIFTLSTRTFF